MTRTGLIGFPGVRRRMGTSAKRSSTAGSSLYTSTFHYIYKGLQAYFHQFKQLRRCQIGRAKFRSSVDDDLYAGFFWCNLKIPVNLAIIAVSFPQPLVCFLKVAAIELRK